MYFVVRFVFVFAQTVGDDNILLSFGQLRQKTVLRQIFVILVRRFRLTQRLAESVESEEQLIHRDVVHFRDFFEFPCLRYDRAVLKCKIILFPYFQRERKLIDVKRVIFTQKFNILV